MGNNVNELRFVEAIFSYTSTAKWKINFSLKGGDIYQLIGDNGSGKSTVGRVLTGIELYQLGNAWFNGQSVGKMTNEEKRKIFFFIPQEPHWSFIGESFCKNLRYFSIDNKECDSIDVGCKKNTLHSRLRSIANQSVFDLSSEDVFLLALWESRIWKRTILFVDEYPDFHDEESRTFFEGILKKRAEEKMITIIARHVPIDFLNVATINIDVSRFKFQ